MKKYGRFTGGKHFSKKALKAGNEMISAAQKERFKALGLTEYNFNNLSYNQAAYLLKELKRDKEATLERIRTL